MYCSNCLTEYEQKNINIVQCDECGYDILPCRWYGKRQFYNPIKQCKLIINCLQGIISGINIENLNKIVNLLYNFKYLNCLLVKHILHKNNLNKYNKYISYIINVIEERQNKPITNFHITSFETVQILDIFGKFIKFNGNKNVNHMFFIYIISNYIKVNNKNFISVCILQSNKTNKINLNKWLMFKKACLE
jgi:hypothetical protein